MRFLFLLLFLPLVVCAQGPTVFIPFMMDDPYETDWARRVVANGGALPSLNTITAMETLRLGCIAASLTNKIYSLCVFVPDSVIAASTPLFKHRGADPWTNSGFVIGDLSVNGLKGDGVSKFLDTAIIAKLGQGANSVGSSNLGITVIITESATNVNSPILMNQQLTPDNYAMGLFVSGGGSNQYYNGFVGAAHYVVTNDLFRVGYVSANSISLNFSLYVASPVESHKKLSDSIADNPNTGFPATVVGLNNSTIPVFAYRINGTNAGFNTMRASLVMLHEAFTQTESSNFWILAKACRETLGGGTGDPTHDWNNKIVLAGGDNISSTTSNAVRTFYSGLDTDALLYRMIVVNPYAPDNLTAARTPLICQSGAMFWTNNNFGSSNLTVNGLQGNLSTKSLGVGVNFATLTVRGFNGNNVGLSIMTSEIPFHTNVHNFGSAGTAASSVFDVGNNSGDLTFYAWKFAGINTNFVVYHTAQTNFASYLSGNRTATNAIALYVGTNGTFFVATNATGTQTGSGATMTNCVAHAVSSPTGIGNWSNERVSFIALHPGLTQTESSNLYMRVHTMRTAMGGGSP
jgi:hypothetical protein